MTSADYPDTGAAGTTGGSGTTSGTSYGSSSGDSTGDWTGDSTGNMSGDSGGNSSAADAKDHAKHAASTAADETKHVASVAQEEIANVAAEAKTQAMTLLDEAKAQMDDHSRSQRDRLVTTLQSFSSDLDQMAADQTGVAADLARQAADSARSLTYRIQDREPADLLEDVRDLARRKPGMFLAGALAAGVVAGRFARGAKAAQTEDKAHEKSSSDQWRASTSGSYASDPTGAYSAGFGPTTSSSPGRIQGDPLTDDLPAPGLSTQAGGTWSDTPGGGLS